MRETWKLPAKKSVYAGKYINPKIYREKIFFQNNLGAKGHEIQELTFKIVEKKALKKRSRKPIRIS